MKILIIDDHPLLLAGLARLLSVEFGAATEQAATAAEGFEKFGSFRPEITVLDLNLPDEDGLTLLRRLKDDDPSARIVVLSMHTDALSASASLRGGAIAYLSKSAPPEQILEAVRKAALGQPYLQPAIAQDLAFRQATRTGNPFDTLAAQDMELLRLILAGKRADEIARALGLAEKTIANRKTALRAKLHVSSDVELVKASLAAGMTVG
jgi:DNA-binding NarL/FixJ family response regulator